MPESLIPYVFFPWENYSGHTPLKIMPNRPTQFEAYVWMLWCFKDIVADWD